VLLGSGAGLIQRNQPTEQIEIPVAVELLSEPVSFTYIEPEEITIPDGVFCRDVVTALNALETNDATQCLQGTGVVVDVIGHLDVSVECYYRGVFEVEPKNAQIDNPPRYYIFGSVKPECIAPVENTTVPQRDI